MNEVATKQPAKAAGDDVTTRRIDEPAAAGAQTCATLEFVLNGTLERLRKLRAELNDLEQLIIEDIAALKDRINQIVELARQSEQAAGVLEHTLRDMRAERSRLVRAA